MSVLLDTAILLRLVNPADTQHGVAQAAVLTLAARGEILHIAPQNLVEFRSGATRPSAANGLGYSPAATEQEAAQFERAFSLLPEAPEIFSAWKRLAAATGVIGKQVHDARLAAICHVYGIQRILTFNVQHFLRFADIAPGLDIIHPSNI